VGRLSPAMLSADAGGPHPGFPARAGPVPTSAVPNAPPASETCTSGCTGQVARGRGPPARSRRGCRAAHLGGPGLPGALSTRVDSGRAGRPGGWPLGEVEQATRPKSVDLLAPRALEVIVADDRQGPAAARTRKIEDRVHRTKPPDMAPERPTPDFTDFPSSPGHHHSTTVGSERHTWLQLQSPSSLDEPAEPKDPFPRGAPSPRTRDK
jgi:hypothetical protein